MAENKFRDRIYWIRLKFELLPCISQEIDKVTKDYFELADKAKEGDKEAFTKLYILNISINKRIEEIDSFYEKNYKDQRVAFFEKLKLRLKRILSPTLEINVRLNEDPNLSSLLKSSELQSPLKKDKIESSNGKKTKDIAIQDSIKHDDEKEMQNNEKIIEKSQERNIEIIENEKYDKNDKEKNEINKNDNEKDQKITEKKENDLIDKKEQKKNGKEKTSAEKKPIKSQKKPIPQTTLSSVLHQSKPRKELYPSNQFNSTVSEKLPLKQGKSKNLSTPAKSQQKNSKSTPKKSELEDNSYMIKMSKQEYLEYLQEKSKKLTK